MIAFRNSLLDYLGAEKDLATKETDRRKALSRSDKIDEGLILPECPITASVGGRGFTEYCFRIPGDQMAFRIGERVSISRHGASAVKGTVLDSSFDTLVVRVEKNSLDETQLWDLESSDSPLYDGFISSLSSIDESAPGASFLEQLCGKKDPVDNPTFGPNPLALGKARDYGKELDVSQEDALLTCAGQPSLHLVQGPPGTGKTRVLASLAASLSFAGMEVSIVAKTHQAVNNALNAVIKRSPATTVVKVGQLTRSEGLDPAVMTFDTYSDYLTWRKKSKRRGRTSDVVGMTLNAAAVNMCLRNTGFKPQSVLVDEASQIPVAEAAMLGASGAGSIIFFGDDRQMPPIFYAELKTDSLSESVFSFIRRLYPDRCSVLGVSYRMNDEICSFVSRAFYEPYGVTVSPSPVSAPRRLVLTDDADDKRIPAIFTADVPSIVSLNVSEKTDWRNSNQEEALFAADIACYAVRAGVKPVDIAIVTPFRHQVSRIRAALRSSGLTDPPLVDTVERLQGQDVRLIILSFSVTDSYYYASVRDFLQDKNRLNVMVSRAKEKVVILNSGLVRIE